MDKSLALLALVMGLFMYYLNSTGKFIPAVDAVLTNPSTVSDSLPTLGAWVLAVIGFIVVLSFLPDGDAIDLTVLVSLGALVYDAKKNGTNSLLQKL